MLVNLMARKSTRYENERGKSRARRLLDRRSIDASSRERDVARRRRRDRARGRSIVLDARRPPSPSLAMDSPHVARDRRQRRDACWAVSFLVVATSAIALGIAGSMTTPSGSDVRVDWRALRGGDACAVGDDAAWAEVLDANRERIAANERRTTARLGLGAGKGYGRRSSMMLGQSSGSTTSAASGPEAIDAKAMFAKVWPWVLVAFAGAFGLGIYDNLDK